jgi:hypothetical protein
MLMLLLHLIVSITLVKHLRMGQLHLAAQHHLLCSLPDSCDPHASQLTLPSLNILYMSVHCRQPVA